MRVYFAGTIMGDRRHLPAFQRIVSHLQALGHSVPTAHVARSRVLKEEDGNTAQQVYDRDVAWLRAAHCLVAEVSSPSLGVGYEICYALLSGVPCLCLYRAGVRLSKMILGCTETDMRVRPYQTEEEMLALVDRFLQEVALRRS